MNKSLSPAVDSSVSSPVIRSVGFTTEAMQPGPEAMQPGGIRIEDLMLGAADWVVEVTSVMLENMACKPLDFYGGIYHL